VFLTACTSVYLESTPAPQPTKVDHAVSLDTRLCTEDPGEFVTPIKILFALDYSQSTLVSDPNFSRAQAVVNVIQQLGQSPALSIAIMQFRGDVNVITHVTNANGVTVAGFQPSTELSPQKVAGELSLGLPSPSDVDEETTDFIAALNRAQALIENDILQGQDNPGLLARTTYVVVFASDGIPTKNYPPNCQPGGVGGNACPVCIPAISSAVASISALVSLGAGAVRVNTALFFNNPSVPPPPATVHAAAAGLMQCMATAGGGTFTDFTLGETLSFLGYNYGTVQLLFAPKTMLVMNLNARFGTFEADSDGDGISDAREIELGSDPLNPDTDGDGYGDLLEATYPETFHINQFDPGCPPEQRGDTDGDGLTDCEEIFVGTSPTNYDTDGDGVPDGIEWKAGTLPASADMTADPDLDGRDNYLELREHTNPRTADSDDLTQTAERYTVSSLGPPVGGISCYTLHVENIRLARTQALPSAEAGINNLAVIYSQAPLDAPNSQPVHRVAIVQARLTGDVQEPSDGILKVPLSAVAFPTATPPPSTQGTPP
jgi:hypothetical protein